MAPSSSCDVAGCRRAGRHQASGSGSAAHENDWPGCAGQSRRSCDVGGHGWGNGAWPDSGEIDMMEHVGYDVGTVHGTVHTKA